MDFSKFLSSNTGKYIMSIILGLGLATLFRAICEGNSCVVYQAPSFSDIKDKYYKFDKECYQFEPSQVTCDSKKQIINFA